MRYFVVLIVLLATFSFFYACAEKKEAEQQAQQEQTMQTAEQPSGEVELAANMAIDPVCGMKVNKDEAQFTVDHEGKTYYFCMEKDKLAFVENPQKYLTKE